jgi:hypothetical protein
MRNTLILCGAALVCAALAGPTKAPSVGEQVRKSYQEVFDDISLIDKDNRFGVSRLEGSSITGHGSGRKRYGQVPGHTVGVVIYGNKGKPMEPGAYGQRYSRFPFPGHRGAAPDLLVVGRSVAKKAVAAYSKGNLAPVVAKSGLVTVEAHPIRLTKKECLSCHGGMKVGDPVAVIVVSSAPSQKKAKRTPKT